MNLYSKHRYLIKFTSLLLPNGYILDTIGPFSGTMNNAPIAKEITSRCDAFAKWCERGDIMIIDRGFRNILETFIEMGYEPKMLDFLSKGKYQHTRETGKQIPFNYKSPLENRIVPCSYEKMDVIQWSN